MPADDRLEAKLAALAFGDPKVRAFLDDMSIEAVQRAIGNEGVRRVVYHAAQGDHWSPGKDRPVWADDDPAVMQGIGRCAAARARGWEGRPSSLDAGSVHPATCGWCLVPLEELLAACAWDVWRSYFVVLDVYTWLGGKEGDLDRPTYDRPGPWSGTYQSPPHRDFWSLSAKDRRARVEAAIIERREAYS